MFCPKCGAEIVGEAQFCSSCGSKTTLQEKEKWVWWQFFLLMMLAGLCPIAGWIIGGINFRHKRRRNQCFMMIGFAIASFLGLVCNT